MCLVSHSLLRADELYVVHCAKDVTQKHHIIRPMDRRHYNSKMAKHIDWHMVHKSSQALTRWFLHSFRYGTTVYRLEQRNVLYALCIVHTYFVISILTHKMEQRMRTHNLWRTISIVAVIHLFNMQLPFHCIFAWILVVHIYQHGHLRHRTTISYIIRAQKMERRKENKIGERETPNVFR